MVEFKPVRVTVAEMIRDFNAGVSRYRTATDLAGAIILETESDVRRRVTAGSLMFPNPDGATALQMVRDSIEQCLGIWASLDSQEAVLKKYGPRLVDEATALCEGVSRAALDLCAALQATKDKNDDKQG